MSDIPDLSSFPGGNLVSKGLADLELGDVSEEALLVLVASPRLRRLGFTIPIPAEVVQPYEHRLYEVIENRMERGVHSAYNALIRRIVSFEQTYQTHRRNES